MTKHCMLEQKNYANPENFTPTLLVMLETFRRSELGKQSRKTICSYLDIVKIALTPPLVFLDNYKALFCKPKQVPKKKVSNEQI